MGCTFEETTDTHMIISQEQYDYVITHQRLRVVNGQIIQVPIDEAGTLFLKEGGKWKTAEDNMLIMGNDRGWDDQNT